MGPEFESPAGHQKEQIPIRASALFMPMEIRRSKMQQSGGLLLPPVQTLGSDPTAASGRRREGSEWQRSTDAKAYQRRRQMSGTATGGYFNFCPTGKNANESPAGHQKIDKLRQRLVDFYLLLLHYSLFTKNWASIFGR